MVTLAFQQQYVSIVIIYRAKLLEYDKLMRRAFFRNSGQNYLHVIGGYTSGNICDFVYKLKYKIMTSRFVEADNKSISVWL